MATYTGKTYTGTAGSDKLVGGRGNDIFKYTLDSTRASQDIYTGGGGIDTLQLQLSYQQWLDLNAGSNDPATNQIVACLNYLSTAKKSTSGEIASGTSFTFNFGNSTTLKIQMIEKLQVMVDVKGDGKYVNLIRADDNVRAMNDTATFDVNSTAISINVLANDSVPDLVRSLAFADQTLTSWSLKYGIASTETSDSSDPTNASKWSFNYQLDKTTAAYQALGKGITATDIFYYTVTDADGDSDTAMVTVTVTGTVDHDATISDATLSDGKDDFKGSVTEAGWSNNGGTPTASGQLRVEDVDKDDNKFIVSSGTSTKGYGSYSINAVGQWAYTLNNANKDVQALKKGDSLVDTFTVQSIDNSDSGKATITITITGADDLPVANKDVLWVTSNDTVTLDTAVLLNNDTNVENRTLSVTGVLVQTGEEGPSNLTLSEDGTTFSFDSGNSALAGGDPIQYTFTYIVDNGTEQTVTGTVEVNVLERKESDANSIDLSAQTNYAGSYLKGGASDDTFTGGSGADVFVPTVGKDTIQNFTYDTVLDFESFATESYINISNNYAGLQWTNAYVINQNFSAQNYGIISGYLTVLNTEKFSVFNGGAGLASFSNDAEDFDFVSGYFAAAYQELEFTITAYDDDKEVGLAVVTVTDTKRIKIDFLNGKVTEGSGTAVFDGTFTSVDKITWFGGGDDLTHIAGDDWVLRYDDGDPDRIDVPDSTDVDALINGATTNEAEDTVLHFNDDTLTLTGVPIGALDESWFI